MKWINIKDKLPIHNQVVLVNTPNGIAVAEYSKDFGFEAEWSAYDIFVHDDSGLSVHLDGEVIHWMQLPYAPQNNKE